MEPSEYANIARLEDTHGWYTGMAAIAAGWLRALPLPRPARILDAGCGTGGGLRWLGAFGRPVGVDLHPLAVRLAAGKGARRLAQASVAALPFSGGAFDLLTSFDVLYHRAVPDDGQALREFARVLRPGGWLLLRLPAYDSLRGAHDQAVHTRHRYTCAEVRARLKAAGLQPRRVTYANALLLPAAAAWRSGGRGRAASDARPLPRLLNRLLHAGLQAEGLWLRRFDLPAGLSVMALAQRE